MSPLLESLLQQAYQLPRDEKLILIRQVTAQLRELESSSTRKHRLSEFRGMVSHPVMGEDAQVWVTRTRQAETAHRLNRQ